MIDIASIEANHWRRAWLLLILDGAARSGLTPIDHATLHQAAFLANALAPVYNLPVENGLVTRWKRGPYFPEIQWDLDRMAAMGLAKFQRIRHLHDRDGWWFGVTYELGPRAPEFLDRALVFAATRRVHRFHCELMAALANLPDADQRRAAIEDANYANTVDGDLGESETVIDFGQWSQRNFTVRATRSIDDQRPGPPIDERGKVHLYLRYLARCAARARTAE